MKKLELKHLAPYLPYGVKVKTAEKKITTLVGINFKDKTIDLDWKRKYKGCSGEIVSYYDGKNRGHDSYIDFCKLILRPLSDLTKEIKVNGERFIPSDIIFPKEEYSSEKERQLNIQILINHNAINHSCTYFEIVQKLFEWHFDVFGLIDKGLAIDINTLKEILLN